jgi:hypothetical protein
VEGELERADQAYARAAAWEGWADYGRRTTPRFKRVVPLASGLTLLAALAFPVSQALGIRPEAVGTFVTPLLVVPPFVLMAYLLAQSLRGGAAARRAVASEVAVACPNCGAAGRIGAGAPAQVCGYCHATLVVSAPVIEGGVDAAALAHRHARLEELRQERAGMASLAAYDMTPYVPYFVLGPFLFMTGGGAVGLSFEMLRGAEPYSPAIFVLWALFLALVAGGLGWIYWQRNRLAAYRRAADDLARQFSGRRLDTLRDTTEWLDRFWPERYEGTKSYPGVFYVSAALDAFGYPALLVCDASRGKGRLPRLHLLLAAIRGPHPPPADARAALTRCRELGFTVSFTEAGLLARADHPTLELVQKTPAALHGVAPALTAMARAAHALGAAPAR